MAIGDKQWLVTKPAGGDLISDIDGYQEDNNYALETILAKYRHVTTVYNSSTTEITIGASEVACTNGTTYKFRAITSNITCTASLGASKWYKVFAVADATATTFTGEIVEDGSSPAGTHTRLISMFRTTSGSVIEPFVQKGDDYNFSAWQTLTSGNLGSSAWVAVDTTNFVPVTLSSYCYGTIKPSSVGAISNLNSVATGATTAPNKYGGTPGSGSTRIERWELDILTANTLYALSDSSTFIAYLHGFKINNL